MLWKIISEALPTLDRLSQILDIDGKQCYLCNDDEETKHHLLSEYMVTRRIWWNSLWNIIRQISSHTELRMDPIATGKEQPL